MEGDRLLVGEREDEAPAPAILEVEQLRDRGASCRLPELDGREHRHEHLLAADRVHLLADDLDDLLVNPPTEREERPYAGAHLADVAAPHEQLVRCRLSVGGVVAQGRDEER